MFILYNYSNYNKIPIYFKLQNEKDVNILNESIFWLRGDAF
jgi:hypothetical protein